MEQGRTIPELFAAQVARTPDAVAVAFEGQSLTYAQLNRRANQLARHLRGRGVGPERLVGVFLGRSVEMVAGLLGVLKAGGAYVPLDPNYPAERLQYMLDDARPQVVLTHAEMKAELPTTSAEVIDLNATLQATSGYVDTDLASSDVGLTPQNLVYVIYTSGSTGQPKGTEMPHGAMVNLIEWHRETLPGADGLRVLQFAALSFDVAFQEIFSTLCTGGTLVLLGEWIRRDSRALSEFLIEHGVQRLFVPPLMLQSLAECYRASDRVPLALRDVIAAGEQLRVSPEIVSLFGRLDGARLHNHYGPTETHVVTALTLSGDPTQWPARPSIGVPISNTTIHLLDEDRQSVEEGAVGEIYIGGANVARGYRLRQDLTAQRFIVSAAGSDAPARLYKTGDLGQWRPDGTLDYLGRNDDQVKIRGYRIELGEIEAQLARHEGVKECAVAAREDVPGNRRLVAYFTSRGPTPPAAEALRTHLKAVLPDYMVPGAFVRLESLPLTPSGKLNRRALPAPSVDAYATREYEAPQGAVETALADIWSELLQVDRVGRNDNFFELGGHSLLIVRMLQRLRESGFTLEMGSVYERPTLASLADAVSRDSGAREIEVPANLIPEGCEAITPQMLTLVDLDAAQIRQIERSVPGGAPNIEDIYPLAPLQEGLLFHHELDARTGDTYVLPMLLSVSSREKLDALIEALQRIIDRYDILRTAVLWEQLPRPVQVVYRQARLPVEFLKRDGGSDAIEQLRARMKPESLRIDLQSAPLMRLEVMPDARGSGWHAILKLHHFTADHESVEIMLSEVGAYVDGGREELPTPAPYRNHVAQAQALGQARAHEAEQFFRARLGDVEESTASFGLLDVYGNGSRIRQVFQSLDLPLARRIRAQARHFGVSAATLFHAAWGLVVAHTSGRDDVVFGTVLLGRMLGSAGAQRTLGMFINTLPLRLRLANVSASALLQQAQLELAQLLTHEQASLALAQSCSGIVGAAPLFNTLLNYRHVTLPIETGQPHIASGVQVLASSEWSNYPIVLSIDDLGEGFTLTAQTDLCIDPARLIGYVCTALHGLVDALEAEPQKKNLELRILPEAERQEVTQRFNATHAPRVAGQRVHELVERQAQRDPRAIAVVCGEQRLTYADLDQRANGLARYLQEQGVGPDRLVGVCCERSVELIVALFAILKAGGAYVPLDPTYPAERLAFMVNDSAPVVVLTQERLRHIVPTSAAKVLALDSEDLRREVARSSSPPSSQVSADHLAYVIYTSGSTGTPKGVMVAHRSLCNLMGWHCDAFGLRAGSRSSSLAAIGFDAAAWEIWPPLGAGGTLVLAPPEVAGNVESLLEWWSAQPLDVSFLPTPLAELAFQRFPPNPRLRTLLVGGDRLRSRPKGASFTLVNNYGPTESTVVATSGTVSDSDAVLHIGRPVANTQIYILDSRREPVPVQVTGELYIGGASLARGYLNRADLTAERFVPDPFSADVDARMYRTGDLGRWREDGTIEFLGRNDHQVKVRGFRIELGEIEGQLLAHPGVREAAVVAREEQPGETRLCAYVVAEPSRSASRRANPTDADSAPVVDQWKTLYDETYSEGAVRPTFVGWNSSYTGQPIPESQMQDWLDGALKRIRSINPRKLLEIGCGVGLLTQHLGRECEQYVGTDFSAAAVGRLRQWLNDETGLRNVQLMQRSATELQDLQSGTFDTVVLNSVVQYFPDAKYLLQVLSEAVRLVKPGGTIFVGDVRHLGLLPTFHTAVQLGKAAATIRVGQLRSRIARVISQDKELVIDPEFFEQLPQRLQGISSVEVQLKRGFSANELTRYRYDVVLKTGERPDSRALYEPLQWGQAVKSAEELEKALQERRWVDVCLHGVPNPRLLHEAKARELLETSEEQRDVSGLRAELNQMAFEGIDPERLWALGDACGYEVQVSWGTPAACMQVRLLDRSRADQARREAVHRPSRERPWSDYTNDPLESSLRQQLIPQLREYLKERLPEYMQPSAWMLMKELPLTPNGKLDRRALPPPQSRPEEMGEYVEPRTQLDRTLAQIWAQVLRVDRVGIHDNFFDLGGHSLVATQVMARLAFALSIEMPVRLLFDFPTIEALGNKVEELREKHLLYDLEEGGNEIEALLERVASMPDSEVQSLIRELRMEGRA